MIFIIIPIAVIALLGVLYVILRRLVRIRVIEVMYHVAGQEIGCMEKAANFFGRQSAGVVQVRGNGVLVLTDRLLYFKMWTPAKEIEIPLKNIKDIKTPKGFLGKTRFSKLLQIDFINEKGQLDSVAWQVRNLEQWLSLLKTNRWGGN